MGQGRAENGVEGTRKPQAAREGDVLLDRGKHLLRLRGSSVSSVSTIMECVR